MSYERGMSTERFPQAREMADESMVRNLAAQAEAIWPQEEPLLRRYPLPAAPRVLDAGCGTGEISSRLARLFPAASVLGVDILDGHLAVARERHGALRPRLAFEHRSVYDLGLPAASFDLAVCRHVLQSIPHPEQVLAELVRVTRPGGRLHLLCEDYGMIHFPKRRLDPDRFWPAAPYQVSAATGVDMTIGRNAHAHLRALGLADVTVDYVVVDTLRVPRQTFAAIWEAWRDGYVDYVASHTSFSAGEVRAHFEDQLATLADPDAYAAWLVPIVAARVP